MIAAREQKTLEFLEDGTIRGTDVYDGRTMDTEGVYEFISKDRMKIKISARGHTKDLEVLVSIEGDALTLTTIDPDPGNTGEGDDQKKEVIKLKRVE
mgnify:CR=1 FL=1